MTRETRQYTMRAAAIDEFGGPIAPRTLPVPQVEADEILIIRVESAGAQRALDEHDLGKVVLRPG